MRRLAAPGSIAFSLLVSSCGGAPPPPPPLPAPPPRWSPRRRRRPRRPHSLRCWWCRAPKPRRGTRRRRRLPASRGSDPTASATRSSAPRRDRGGLRGARRARVPEEPVPGAEIRWAGFVGDDAVVIATKDTLHRADSPSDAVAGKLAALPPLDPMATKIASAGKIVVAAAPAADGVFLVSRDGGKSFTAEKRPAPGPIADVAVRTDGFVAVAIEQLPATTTRSSRKPTCGSGAARAAFRKDRPQPSSPTCRLSPSTGTRSPFTRRWSPSGRRRRASRSASTPGQHARPRRRGKWIAAQSLMTRWLWFTSADNFIEVNVPTARPGPRGRRRWAVAGAASSAAGASATVTTRPASPTARSWGSGRARRPSRRRVRGGERAGAHPDDHPPRPRRGPGPDRYTNRQCDEGRPRAAGPRCSSTVTSRASRACRSPAPRGASSGPLTPPSRSARRATVGAPRSKGCRRTARSRSSPPWPIRGSSARRAPPTGPRW